MAHDERHVRLRELTRGMRRRCVLLAIGMTWFAFSLFLLWIASWVWLKPQPPDAGAIATLVLIAVSIGINHGTRAQLTLKDPESTLNLIPAPVEVREFQLRREGGDWVLTVASANQCVQLLNPHPMDAAWSLFVDDPGEVTIADELPADAQRRPPATGACGGRSRFVLMLELAGGLSR